MLLRTTMAAVFVIALLSTAVNSADEATAKTTHRYKNGSVDKEIIFSVDSTGLTIWNDEKNLESSVFIQKKDIPTFKKLITKLLDACKEIAENKLTGVNKDFDTSEFFYIEHVVASVTDKQEPGDINGIEVFFFNRTGGANIWDYPTLVELNKAFDINVEKVYKELEALKDRKKEQQSELKPPT